MTRVTEFSFKTVPFEMVLRSNRPKRPWMVIVAGESKPDEPRRRPAEKPRHEPVPEPPGPPRTPAEPPRVDPPPSEPPPVRADVG
jgi:hypothetical protein